MVGDEERSTVGAEAPAQVVKKSSWDILGMFKKVPESERSGSLSDRELQKQGATLIREAIAQFRKSREFAEEQKRIYREASSYRSLERPMRTSVDFSAGNDRYDVILNETQNTDPLSLIMTKGKPVQNPGELADETTIVDLRESATSKPIISRSKRDEGGSGSQPLLPPNTWESVRGVRQAIAELGKQLDANPT